jgi:hypothetical protein
LDTAPGNGSSESSDGRASRSLLARSLSLAVACWILIVVGIIAATIGMVLLLMALANADRSSLPNYLDAVPGGFAVPALLIGLGLLAFGGAEVLTGIQAMRGRGWALGVGIGLALVEAFVLGYVMLSGTGTAPVIFAPIIVGLVFAAAAMANEMGWFAPGAGQQ